jgi:hypothetical protein
MTGRHPALAALAAALLLAGCAAINESIDSATSSTPRETQGGPGGWTMTIGNFTANADALLLYRAAVHAKAEGYPNFQIVDYEDGNGSSAVGIWLRSQGVGDPAPPLTCLAEGAFRAHCATWKTDAILKSHGRILGKTPLVVEGDVAMARRLDAGK